ncbi:hypothetical protein CW740_00545 [Kangiella profundi]|uniref:Uncharacterized protein n=1 Tax=Kangiella profundi TaxID=1561924 RepID=A0A2K9ARM0_9GAMM|nr:outer membrane beta-barrel protein [Kangiella profundi]AUD77801.1 hypothetical protein CW740_00545 [Kangiella profundi]GGE92408.1 hypothetical protein GCM10011356_03170 [Kangiella profundi]
MTRKIFKSLILIGSIIFISSTIADDSSFYLGISGGSAQVEGETVQEFGVLPGQSLNDDTDSYGVYAGYKLNDYFGFELEYMDLDDARKTYSLDPDVVYIVAPNDTITTNIQGIKLSSLFEYPFTDGFGIYGKLGVARVTMENDLFIGAAGPGQNLSAYSSDDSEVEIIYGAGLRFELVDRLNLKIEWEKFNANSPTQTATPNLETDVDVTLIGIKLDYLF